ncbi:hypothetical protein PG990_008058 [Apiospora arundinis]
MKNLGCRRYPHPYKEQKQPALLSTEPPSYDHTFAQFENFNRFFKLLVKECGKTNSPLPVPMLPAFKAMDAVLEKQDLPSYGKLRVALDWVKDPELVDAMKRRDDDKRKCTVIKENIDGIIKYWKQRLQLLEKATEALRVEEA